MGGWGSGSARRSGRPTTDDATHLRLADAKTIEPVRALRRVLEADPSARVELEIAERANFYHFRAHVGTRTRLGLRRTPGEVDPVNWMSQDSFFVALTATHPNYGGTRLWFVCPRSTCNRRCAVLYREQRTNARAFTCLRCAGLVYTTQRLGRVDRMEYRAAKLAFRLDRLPEERNALVKPKWMRWRTFDRIIGEIKTLEDQLKPARRSQYVRFEKFVQEIESSVMREAERATRTIARTRPA